MVDVAFSPVFDRFEDAAGRKLTALATDRPRIEVHEVTTRPAAD